MMHSIHKSRHFSIVPLYRRKAACAFTYLKERTSFWIAALSILAFVAGNMVGQHGWRAFWASVLGGYDDSLILYTGTVPPVELVPDYARWIRYGGDPTQHTFRQVPQDMLIPLPRYDVNEQRMSYADSPQGDVYSIGHMGSYATGAEGEGSHPGIDIRLPEGTPIRSVAAGIVTQVREDRGGFGKIVVIRHPNIPDPDHSTQTTVLHSVYAHLSAQYIKEGDIVKKGQEIGLSGSTGFVTGPHLHFQIDRDGAPWHPYWPFTSGEAQNEGWTLGQAIDHALHQERGYEYTVNPMVFVQSNYPPVQIAARGDSSSSVSSSEPKKLTLRERRSERLTARIERNKILAMRMSSSSSAVSLVALAPLVVKSETLVAIATPEDRPASPASVASIGIEHDGSFSGRDWETVTIVLQDTQGNVVRSPHLSSDLYLRTAFGEAEFRPEVLSALDFNQGKATVKVLPRGRRTLIIQIMPMGALSLPMVYEN